MAESKKLYPCPNCSMIVLKYGATECPDCHAKVKFFRNSSDKVVRGRPTFRVELDREISDNVITYDAKQPDQEQRTVVFEPYYQVKGWVFCPSCKHKMFQNNTLQGSMQVKCARCNVVVTFVFQSIAPVKG